MATIYDVCREAGVSMATVSRVINGAQNVRMGTRQRVLDAMSNLGYQPSSIAQSLASKRTNSVGLQVSELAGAFYGPMMVGIEEQLRLARKQVFITSGHSDEQREREGIDSLVSRNCDALILHVDAVSDDYLIEVNNSGTPVVLINRYIEALADRCIVLDNFRGGYLATDYLIKTGHQHIACISGPQWKHDAQDRLAGYIKALQDNNIDYDEQLVVEGDYREISGSNGLKLLLERGQAFTALVCGNDEMAAGALNTARESGIQIPEQLSIVGFDDVSLAYYLYPKLTTIRYPIENMAAMAACWVLQNVYSQPNDITTTFVPELILRDSCRPGELH